MCGVTDDCHPTLATCTDTGPNAYKCECIPGYAGDGKICIRECSLCQDIKCETVIYERHTPVGLLSKCPI